MNMHANTQEALANAQRTRNAEQTLAEAILDDVQELCANSPDGVNGQRLMDRYLALTESPT